MVERQPTDKLRDFKATHIDENLEGISGLHENELFHNCTFKKLRGLTLKDCVLSKSKFTTDDIRDALGFTLTLDCLSFHRVEFSELLFDLFLVLAIKSKGNDEKRKKLVDVIGKERVLELLHQMSDLEL